MKDVQKNELDILLKVCNQNDVPSNLGGLLVKYAKDQAYENNSQQARIKEYQSLIDFHFKNKK